MADMDKSQPESPLDVPLSKWSTVNSALSAINDKYGLSLQSQDFEDRSSFRNDASYLSLELVSVVTGELVWTVVDSTSSNIVQDINETIEHPKTFPFPNVLSNFGILINNEKELEFLKDVRLDVRYNSGVVGGDKSYILMNLLNNYNIGDGWTSNPSQGCTTAYFIPRYYGTGKDAPGVYNFNPEAKLMVVVELMMYGEYQLHALVVR